MSKIIDIKHKNLLFADLKIVRDPTVKIRLEQVKLITNNEQDPVWLSIKNFYETATDPYERMWLSLMNSILYHKRIVFCMSRDISMAFMRNDPNFKNEPTAMANATWKGLLKELFNNKKIKELKRAHGRGLNIYQVISPGVLSILGNDWKIDAHAQAQECLDFIKNIDHSKQK